MIFDGFFGIDWSGDKSKFQKGIKVAYLDKKNINPVIISPPNKKIERRANNVVIEVIKVLDNVSLIEILVKSKILFSLFFARF